MKLRVDLLTNAEISVLKNKILEIRNVIDTEIMHMHTNYYSQLININSKLLKTEEELLALQNVLILELDIVDTTSMDAYNALIDIDYLNNII